MIVSVGSHLQRMRGIHWFHSAIASSESWWWPEAERAENL